MYVQSSDMKLQFVLDSDGALYQWGVHPHMLKMVIQQQRKLRLGQPAENRRGDIPELSQHLLPSRVDTTKLNSRIVQVTNVICLTENCCIQLLSYLNVSFILL